METFEAYAEAAKAEIGRLVPDADADQIFNVEDCREQYLTGVELPDEACTPQAYAQGYLDALADSV